jgi:iron complex outermembrane recepter protein
VFDLVKAESAKTVEVGAKTRLLPGLTVNVSAYHTDDKNPFYFLYVPAAGAQVLVNIDKVEIYGGEIELNWRPAPGLDIFANYGITHSEIKSFVFTPADLGNKAPYIPRDSGAVGAQYRMPVTDSLNLFMRGEVEHHGRQYWDPENSTARSSFQLVNLRGGIVADDDRWSIMGYARNLTNKKYNAEFVSGGYVYPGQPRTYGVELQYKF